METFKGFEVVNEHDGDVIRQWDNNGQRKIDDIFGPYLSFHVAILQKQEQYLKDLDVPFITTETDEGKYIWKEQKAEHVR